MRIRISTVAALALALAILTALPVHAAPNSPRQAEQAGLFSRLVGIVGKLSGRIVATWGKEGAIIDPFGGLGAHPTQGNVPGSHTGTDDDSMAD